MDLLKRSGLHDQVTKKLGLAILSGELREGEISSELALCKRLGVSRTILRESTKVLISKGLVEVRPKVGVRIRSRGDWNLFDPDVLAWQSEVVVDEEFVRTLCEVRLIVETSAAALAAQRATPEERALIAECYRNMELLMNNKAAHDEADVTYHGAIFDACHNELLKQLGKTIRAALRRQDRSGSPSELGKSMELHKDMTLAICKGDAKAAGIAMENIIFHAARADYRMANPEISSGRDTRTDAAQSLSAELSTARDLLKQLLNVLDQTATASPDPPNV
jgi:DNA-binding FadR family transcriptional regulator